jgi:hypothetical protein
MENQIAATLTPNFSTSSSISSSSRPSSRSYLHSNLDLLVNQYRSRDLFSAESRRKNTNKLQTQAEILNNSLYVPRATTALKKDYFDQFAINHKELEALDTTVHAESKETSETHSLDAAVSALHGSSTSLVHLSTGAVLTADSEHYLQKLWLENEAARSSEKRLKSHIKELVGQWQVKLGKFEEEVARKQEQMLYDRYKQLQRLKNSPDYRENSSKPKHLDSPAQHFASHAYSVENNNSSGSNANSATIIPWQSTLPLQPEGRKLTKKQREAAAKQNLVVNYAQSPLSVVDNAATPFDLISQHMNQLNFHYNLAHHLPTNNQNSANNELGASFSPFRVDGGGNNVQIGAEISISGPETPSTRPFTGNSSAAATSRVGTANLSAAKPHPSLNFRPRMNKLGAAYEYKSDEASAKHNAAFIPNNFYGRDTGVSNKGKNGEEIVTQHQLRQAELLEIRDIQQRAAEHNISISRSALERALLAPQYKFTAPAPSSSNNVNSENARFPSPFANLPVNPFVKKNKSPAGKKGKKGKKKQ